MKSQMFETTLRRTLSVSWGRGQDNLLHMQCYIKYCIKSVLLIVRIDLVLLLVKLKLPTTNSFLGVGGGGKLPITNSFLGQVKYQTQTTKPTKYKLISGGGELPKTIEHM